MAKYFVSLGEFQALDTLQQNYHSKIVLQTFKMFSLITFIRKVGFWCHFGPFLLTPPCELLYPSCKGDLCIFASQSFIRRLKKEPLLFVSFHKGYKYTKASNDEHGYKTLFYSILVYLLNAFCFTQTTFAQLVR